MTLSCRESCLGVAEPLAGSAGRADTLFALRWPKPLWHPKDKARSQGLPPALAELESLEKSAGRKLALLLYQDDTNPPTERIQLYAVRAGGDELFRGEFAIDGLVSAIGRWMGGDDTALDRSDERLVLVCTDGRRDRCCAEYGRPILEALRASAPLGWHVLESSHIGGHRFAANCLTLPSGRAYGRLGPRDVAGLAAALADDGVYTPCYRGRWGLSEPAQAAEVWLHEKFPEAEHVEPGAQLDDGDGLRVAARVHLARGDHDVFVVLAERSFEVTASCGEPASQRRRWVPIGMSD